VFDFKDNSFENLFMIIEEMRKIKPVLSVVCEDIWQNPGSLYKQRKNKENLVQQIVLYLLDKT